MSAGTITLTNGTNQITGSGTAFLTDSAAGDMIVAVVGGVTYTLPVKSVESDTALTTTLNYDGPTQSGSAWTNVPRDTLNSITAQLGAEAARALRGLNLDKHNWQGVYSSSGDISVTLPDGSTFTGPSWNSIVASIEGKLNKSPPEAARETIGAASDTEVLKIENNLSEISTAEAKEAARSNLGLGYLSTIQQDEIINRINVGATGYGWNTAPAGGLSASISVTVDTFVSNTSLSAALPGQWTLLTKHGFYTSSNGSANTSGWAVVCSDGGSYNRIWVFRNDGNIQSPAGGFMWGPANTIIDANGFIKSASPIVKLFGNGACELNDASLGTTAERVSEGVYRLSGSLMGFNSDGAWDIEVPSDDNKQPLVWVESSVEANGDIIVKTYHRTHPGAPAFARNTIDGYKNGDPIDIPSGRWIDLRVQVYSDSE